MEQQQQYTTTVSAAQAPPDCEVLRPWWPQYQATEVNYTQQQAQLPPHMYPSSVSKLEPFQPHSAEQHAPWAPHTCPLDWPSPEPFPPGTEPQAPLVPHNTAAGSQGLQLLPRQDLAICASTGASQVHGAALQAPAHSIGTAQLPHRKWCMQLGALYDRGSMELHTPFSMGTTPSSQPWSQADPVPLRGVGAKPGATTAAAAQPAAISREEDHKAQVDHTHSFAAGQGQCTLPEQRGDTTPPTAATGPSDLFGSIDTELLILATDGGVCGSLHAALTALLGA